MRGCDLRCMRLGPRTSVISAGRDGYRNALGGKVALALNAKPAVVFPTAANAVLLPKTKPGAMGEEFVVSTIRGRDVARAERSRVWLGEDSLKALDFGDGVFGVHAVSISNMSMAIVKWRGPVEVAGVCKSEHP
jgi:hypothetical protein